MRIRSLLMLFSLPLFFGSVALNPAQAFEWSGFYVGLNGGYGWAHSTTTDLDGYNTSFPAPADYPASAAGWTAGGQVGVNLQSGNLVWGFEADAGYFDVSAREPHAGTTEQVFGVIQPGVIATLRGRAGFDMNGLLAYGTVGGAYSGVKTGFIDDCSLGVGCNPITVNATTDHFGWIFGGGVEGALGSNMSLRVEYLYFLFPSKTITGTPGVSRFSTNLSAHVIRAGLNLHFN